MEDGCSNCLTKFDITDITEQIDIKYICERCIDRYKGFKTAITNEQCDICREWKHNMFMVYLCDKCNF